MKSMLPALLALLIGAGITLGGAAYFFNARSSESAAELARLRAEAQDASAKAAELEKRLADTQRERDTYLQQAEVLEGQLKDANARRAQRTPELEEASEPETEPIEGFWSGISESLAEAAEDGGDNDRDRWDDPERRQAFAARMQERVNGIFDELLAEAPPQQHEALLALRDYSTYMLDLRRQLWETEDEAQRAALQEELRAAEAEAENLVRDQQYEKLSQIARKYGVRSQEDMDQFVRDMRRTMRDPFFSPFAPGNEPRGFRRGDRGGRGGGGVER